MYACSTSNTFFMYRYKPYFWVETKSAIQMDTSYFTTVYTETDKIRVWSIYTKMSHTAVEGARLK